MFSGCKINTNLRGKTLSVKKWFFVNLVESLLESHAELAGEQWAAEGKFKMHLIVGWQRRHSFAGLWLRNLVESLLESHAENGGEQWAAEGKFKKHLIVG